MHLWHPPPLATALSTNVAEGVCIAKSKANIAESFHISVFSANVAENIYIAAIRRNYGIAILFFCFYLIFV